MVMKAVVSISCIRNYVNSISIPINTLMLINRVINNFLVILEHRNTKIYFGYIDIQVNSIIAETPKSLKAI